MPASSIDTRHLGCGCGTSEAIQYEWLKAEDRKLTGRNRKRTYLHFDKRIGKVKGDTAEDVWNAEIVSRHSFLPLIKVVIEERRFKKQWRELGLSHPLVTAFIEVGLVRGIMV
ncbi:MAG: hypothetical protein P4M11_05615 [Candidatus Pacebacteria bacterium]|nr:hypothetical protein [Candidatus Paceibacterota bacterium]